jgi:hypothetical protein
MDSMKETPRMDEISFQNETNPDPQQTEGFPDFNEETEKTPEKQKKGSILPQLLGKIDRNQ